jgi:hypothetical protein
VHVQAFEWIGRQAATVPEGVSVLEVGSLDINGSVRPLFASADHYHGIDIVDGPGVDEVADAATWTPPRQYDVVVCAEVLEHAPTWEQIVETMWDAVAPGGVLLLTCATDGRAPHSAVDGLAVRDGEHYQNVPGPAVLALVRRWGATDWTIETAQTRGDLYVRVDKPS